jgi:oligopeptide/dipeptide ABC transporter ATP-binding protein
MEMIDEKENILVVRGLKTHFFTEDGVLPAVDGVSLVIGRKQTFALVGESGCGKSVTALSIMRLVPDPPGKTVAGHILLDGRDLLALPESRMRQVRGAKVAMIFQEPMTSLNPVFTIGAQIVEAIDLHQHVGPREARVRAIQLLADVGIPDPAQRFNEYPHQLSGGMRQRAMIAMALSCNPELLIADEPTTALDVTIQAQILDLLRQIQARRGLSILLITHDLAVVAETADVVGVMYAGRLVELADVMTLFAKPMHPYTQGLFRAVPKLGERKDRLETIPGTVPNPIDFPPGCKFHPRCDLTCRRAAAVPADQTDTVVREGQPVRVLRRCARQEPPLREVEKLHWVACWEWPGFENAPATDPADKPIEFRRGAP